VLDLSLRQEIGGESDSSSRRIRLRQIPDATPCRAVL
jgi:hypothetical protein